jgi:hypothetical protein
MDSPSGGWIESTQLTSYRRFVAIAFCPFITPTSAPMDGRLVNISPRSCEGIHGCRAVSSDPDSNECVVAQRAASREPFVAAVIKEQHVFCPVEFSRVAAQRDTVDRQQLHLYRGGNEEVCL